MNAPSPAPQRRRRIQGAAPSPAQPDQTHAVPSPAQPDQSARRRRAPASVQEPVKKTDNAPAKEPTFLEQISTPVRLVLIALCIFVFFSCSVAVTRTYLQEQEARRRLEAEAAERAQHPLEYADLITQYAALQNVDPALVAAIILCESSFDPHAVSYLDARGLMQLMPDTAGWVAQKLGEDGEGYSFDLLFDPETNIRFGTWYLGYLSRRFDGDATKMVCAYHAGQGNVDAWLRNPAYSSDGVTLDVIPTDDTSTYASRVLRARDVYRKHYFPLSTQESAPQP